jgi:hypothetical protein
MLSNGMMRDNPEERVSAKGALELFEIVVQQQAEITRRSKFEGSEEELIPASVTVAAELFRQIKHVLCESISGVSPPEL